MMIFVVVSVIAYQIQVETTASSHAFDNNDEITKTGIMILDVNASSSSKLVNFTLTNQGSEKLWNYDEFDIIVTYDADILGTKTKVTEQFTYNANAFAMSPGHGEIVADFKIQNGTAIMDATLLTDTILEGTDFDACSGDCFIMLTNTRHTGTGRTAAGNGQDTDAWTIYFSDLTGLTTGGGTIEVTRHNTVCIGGSDCDNRWTWQIVEYIGSPLGTNRMSVLDQAICTFAGGLTCTGTAVTPTDTSDVAIIVTGVGNPNTNQNNNDRCLVTATLDGLDQPVFTRKGATGINCDISYAVAEFSGSNWNVERIPHIGQLAALTTESMTDVGSLSRAFIFDVQQRNADGSTTDGISQIGEEVWLSDTNEISFNHPWEATGWGSDMDEVVWVVSNSEISTGKTMIVQRQQPTDQQDTSGPEEEAWSVSVTPLTYNANETAIFGLTTHASGTGNAFPRGSISAISDFENNEIDFWQSDSGQENDYAFEVVEFPRSERCVDGTSTLIAVNEWSINCIMSDYFEPGIINPSETVEILTKLMHPIFVNGFLEVSISTNNGNVSNQTNTVS